MIMLTAWLLFNNHREFNGLPSVCISDVGTCTAKLKPLVEKVKNKKQVSLDINSPTCTSIFLWCLQLSMCFNLITVEDS